MAASGNAKATWQVLPHDAVVSIAGVKLTPAGWITLGPTPTAAVAISREITVASDHTDVILRSLQRKLDGKRSQCPPGHQTILVLKSGQHRVTSESIIHLLRERIWPNPAYRWLTGCAVFSTRDRFDTGTEHSNLQLSENPNAMVPVSASLRELYTGCRDFHLHGSP